MNAREHDVKREEEEADTRSERNASDADPVQTGVNAEREGLKSRMVVLVRRAVAYGAWGLVAPLLANVVLRVVAHDALWPNIVLNMFTPYLYVPAYLALGIAAWQHRPRLAVASGIVILAHLLWVLGPFTRSEPAPQAEPLASATPPFRVVSLNVADWNPSREPIVAELLASNADVIAIQELSQWWSDAFNSEQFLRAYPHRIEAPQEDAGGGGIYARVPLLEKDVVPTGMFPIPRATVVIDGKQVRIYSVHQPPPAVPGGVFHWNRGLRGVLEKASAEKLPVILAGDFNATQHSAWYARFQAAHFRGAHDACGRPLATTWPNGTMRFPNVRLDHVFLPPGIGCVRVAEGEGRGSDHRPVVVDIRPVP
jgi:endonuclease/exonuclease/phosphatase (EEP) superfamily protein YafD